MALTDNLRRRAHSGNLPALTQLADTPDPLGITTATLDVFLHNLRPETHRSISSSGRLLLHGDSELALQNHNWLYKSLVCFRGIIAGVNTTVVRNKFPLRATIAEKIRGHWDTHILPCLATVIELHMLDDGQPPVRSGGLVPLSRQSAFKIDGGLIDILQGKDKVGMADTMHSQNETLRGLVTHLIVQYVDQYMGEPGFEGFVLGENFFLALPIKQYEDVERVLLQHPRFIPRIADYLLLHHSKKCFTKEGVSGIISDF